MSGLCRRGRSLLKWPLPARVTRARNAHNGRLGPLRHPGWPKGTWTGQKPTHSKRSRRRMPRGCPQETPSFVATRCAVRSTLQPIRSTFSDENCSRNAPQFLRKFRASKPGHSPLPDFATDRSLSLKTSLDGRPVERFRVGHGWRVRGLGRALRRGQTTRRVAVCGRPTQGLCRLEILDGERGFGPLENLRKKSASNRPHSPYAFVSNARAGKASNFFCSKRPSRINFVLSSNKRCFSLNEGRCPST